MPVGGTEPVPFEFDQGEQIVQGWFRLSLKRWQKELDHLVYGSAEILSINGLSVRWPCWVLQRGFRGESLPYWLYFSESAVSPDELPLLAEVMSRPSLITLHFSVDVVPVHQGRARYLCFTDGLGMSSITGLVDFFSQYNWPYHLMVEDMDSDLALGERCHDRLKDALSQQTMGTVLYVFGSWTTVDRVRDVASSAGFTNEEVYVLGQGQKKTRVFCIHCYQFTPLTGSRRIICRHCGRELEVYSHWSNRLKAYLGVAAL